GAGPRPAGAGGGEGVVGGPGGAGQRGGVGQGLPGYDVVRVVERVVGEPQHLAAARVLRQPVPLRGRVGERTRPHPTTAVGVDHTRAATAAVVRDDEGDDVDR